MRESLAIGYRKYVTRSEAAIFNQTECAICPCAPTQMCREGGTLHQTKEVLVLVSP